MSAHRPATENHEPWDLSTIGLPGLSIRVRIARNLSSFNLPGNMNRTERVRLEQSIVRSLQVLIDHPDHGGRVYSLTPDFGADGPNPNLISRSEHQALVDAHIMFKEPDPYQARAGIADDWPYGRACYISRDNSVAVWIGEEDHLRIICMRHGTRLADAFDQLRRVVDLVEAAPGMAFARDERYGYITSCPSNLGTGMRASVHVTLAQLNRNADEMKAICDHAGLSICGIAGDRTPVDVDGTLDVSPARRLFIQEREIVNELFQGLRELVHVAPHEKTGPAK